MLEISCLFKEQKLCDFQKMSCQEQSDVELKGREFQFHELSHPLVTGRPTPSPVS